MPTCYGSPIYDGHQPVNDSSCVSFLRNAGAVILGKTVTTEFAWRKPGKTANPHNPEFTPVDLPAVLLQGWQISRFPWPLEPRPGDLSFGRHPIVGWSVSNRLSDIFRWRESNRFPTALIPSDVLSGPAEDLRIFRQAIWNVAGEESADKKFPKIGFCRTPDWEKAGPSTQNALEHARQTWSSQEWKSSMSNFRKNFHPWEMPMAASWSMKQARIFVMN